MNKSLKLVSVLSVFLMGSVMAYAECPLTKDKSDCGASKCSMMKKDCDKGGAESQCPITAKFFKKAHFFMENKKELSLSDEQVKTIRNLKLKVEKIVISQEAGMKLFMLDIEAMLMEDKVDVEGINAMLDKGMAGMAAPTKEVVSAYAELKGLMSAEQMAKAKAIWAAKDSTEPAAHAH